MFKEYILKLKDEPVGKILESENGLTYEVILKAVETLGKRALPIGIFTRDEVDSFDRGDSDKVFDQHRILRWLSERVFPADRDGATDFLISMDIPKYDPWEIAKKTKAISFNDYYWLSTESTDSFSEVHPRAEEVEYDYATVFRKLLNLGDPTAASRETNSPFTKLLTAKWLKPRNGKK